MKVLMVNQKTNYFGEPINIGYIGEFLLKNGIEAHFLDELLVSENEFKTQIKRIDPDVIGIGATTANFNSGIRVAKICKQINENVKVVFGGFHPSALPEETVQNPYVDFVVRGEGEETMLEVVREIERGGNFKKIKGIAFKNNGKVIINKPRPLIMDIDKIPKPQPFLPLKEYSNPPTQCWEMKRGSFSMMLTSRGCPFHCRFCSIHLVSENIFRGHDPERIIEEIDYLVERKFYNLRFVDALFTFNKRRVINICKRIIEEGLDIGWGCNGHVNFVDREMLTWMKKAGCKQIGFGIESGNQNILNHINKGTRLEKIRDSARLTKECGIEVLGYFMLGLPGDTYQTVMETIEFAKSLECTYISFNPVIPYPGTWIYDWAKKNNFILSDNWNDFHHVRNVMMRNENLTEKEIDDLMKIGYRSFYLRPKTMFNVIKNIITKRRFGPYMIENIKRFKWAMGL